MKCGDAMKFKLVEGFLAEGYSEEEIETVKKALETYKSIYKPRGFVKLEDISAALRTDQSPSSVRFRGMQARTINDILRLYLKVTTRFTQNRLQVRF